MLRGMTEKRKAIWFGGLAILVLFGGCLLALLSPRYQVGVVAASFVGYVACTRRALVLCRADDLVFQPRRAAAREAEALEAHRAGLNSGSAAALAYGRSMRVSAPFARSGPSRRQRAPYLRSLDGPEGLSGRRS